MKSVLVTGAAGFIGSHIVEKCLSMGFEVVSTDDLSGGFIENVSKKSKFILGDLKDPAFVTSLFKEDPFDYVYHLGAYAAEGLFHFIRRYNYETNLCASMNLINESVKGNVACFVFASSIAVYGSNQLPMTEEMIPCPEDPYGISKYAVELDLKSCREMFGMDFIIFRPHNVYGERQNISDKYRNVIGIFMNLIMQEKPLTIFGDGKQTRAFSHIDDVAPIITKSPTVKTAMNQTFNIGADKPYSILELAQVIGSAFKKELILNFLPARNEVVHAFSDHSKVREVFGTSEFIDLKTGIKRMKDFVLKQGPQKPVIFDNLEISKNLPLIWQ